MLVVQLDSELFKWSLTWVCKSLYTVSGRLSWVCTLSSKRRPLITDNQTKVNQTRVPSVWSCPVVWSLIEFIWVCLSLEFIRCVWSGLNSLLTFCYSLCAFQTLQNPPSTMISLCPLINDYMMIEHSTRELYANWSHLKGKHIFYLTAIFILFTTYFDFPAYS